MVTDEAATALVTRIYDASKGDSSRVFCSIRATIRRYFEPSVAAVIVRDENADRAARATAEHVSATVDTLGEIADLPGVRFGRWCRSSRLWSISTSGGRQNLNILGRFSADCQLRADYLCVNDPPCRDIRPLP